MEIVERTMNVGTMWRGRRWDMQQPSASLPLFSAKRLAYLISPTFSNEVGVGRGSRFFGNDFHNASVIFHRANEDVIQGVFRGIGAFGLCDSWLGLLSFATSSKQKLKRCPT